MVLFVFQPLALFSEEQSSAADDIAHQEVEEQEEREEGMLPEENLNRLRLNILFAASSERKRAIERVVSLHERDQQRYIEILEKLAIEDLDPGIRKEAVDTLGQIGSPTSENIYFESLKSTNEDIRRSAVRAIQRNEIEAAIPLLMEMLEEKDFSENSILTGNIIRTLGTLEARDSVSFLEERARDYSTDQELRNIIVLFFGEIEAEAARTYLGEIVSDEGEDLTLREYAANSLGRIGNRDDILLLDEILKSIREIPSSSERAVHNRLRLQLITALVRLGDTEVQTELFAAANHDDSNMRLRAVQQIGELNLESAIEMLEYKEQYDQSPAVRKAAEEALLKIRGEPEEQENQVEE